jgi:transglutaminase-like putative cysteine protease
VFSRVTRAEFSATEASVHMRRDLFDNIIASCFFPKPLANLEFALALDLELEPRNPFSFLLTPEAAKLPVRYRESDLLAPFLAGGLPREALPDELLALDGESTVEALVRINTAVHRLVEYERREEGDPLPPEETLRLRRGSCRDSATLLAAVLRGMGLAVRLVSGYLWEPEPDEEGRKAENALHAWSEVYLPGAGWVGMDPTSGVFADHHRLAAAVGLTPADIAPILGHYYGERTICGTLDASLEVVSG